MTVLSLSPSPVRVAVLSRRIRWFVDATISYNVIEAVVAMAAGTWASSSALIGFGLDSVIEVASATAVAWQFAGRDPEAREKTALRVIALSFFGLAAFVSVDARSYRCCRTDSVAPAVSSGLGPRSRTRSRPCSAPISLRSCSSAWP